MRIPAVHQGLGVKEVVRVETIPASSLSKAADTGAVATNIESKPQLMPRRALSSQSVIGSPLIRINAAIAIITTAVPMTSNFARN